MGNQNAKSKTHVEIEKKMKDAENDASNNQSLLLLGAGESGKSTLLRQMRHIWGKQFQAKERQSYQKIVWLNVTECMQTLCRESLKLCYESNIKECEIDEKNKDNVELVLKLDKNDLAVLDENICKCFQNLWSDKGLRSTLLHRDKFYIMDSAEYFLNNMEKYVGADYIPSFEEICHCRVRSIGMKTENFIFNDVLFTVYDLGGQRSARRKWLTVCDNVKAIIFVASLAGYNQVIFEDNKTNRLVESFDVYSKYINHESFKKINIILFLNKNDLFEEMICKIPFSVCPCDDYEGKANDKDDVIQYIVESYRKRTTGYNTQERTIFPHVTCATNTEDVKAVFTAVRHIVIKAHLKDAAILK